MASMLGEFELCMGIPLLGYNIIEEIKLLSEVLVKMADIVIDKIIVRVDRCIDLATKSSALITIISPIVGYEKASEISKLLMEGLPFEEALRLSGIDEETIDKLMDIRKWTETGFPALE
jgi:fumarate hydratase class II